MRLWKLNTYAVRRARIKFILDACIQSYNTCNRDMIFHHHLICTVVHIMQLYYCVQRRLHPFCRILHLNFLTQQGWYAKRWDTQRRKCSISTPRRTQFNRSIITKLTANSDVIYNRSVWSLDWKVHRVVAQCLLIIYIWNRRNCMNGNRCGQSRRG